jgi:hypothetical protein
MKQVSSASNALQQFGGFDAEERDFHASQQKGASRKVNNPRSPFRPPDDEEVFVTRETEKVKQKEVKEAAKHLMIWDKNTATSRAPLRRVKDSDIVAASTEETMTSFNAKQKGFISAAMHIARSRVQFPRDNRPQNMQEFID